MQGKPKVIALLNEALQKELTAITQYFLHAEMCGNWHYDKLDGYIKKLSIVEMKHVEALIEHILFLEGTPNLTELLKISVGQNVKEQVESDLKLEIEAVALYNRAIQIARDEGANASRELFERLLKAEAGPVAWLAAPLHQLGALGYERYLRQQIREEKEGPPRISVPLFAERTARDGIRVNLVSGGCCHSNRGRSCSSGPKTQILRHRLRQG